MRGVEEENEGRQNRVLAVLKTDRSEVWHYFIP